MIESKALTGEERFLDKTDVDVHDREVPEMGARIAIELVSRWGMVAAEPSGEDSAGRQRLALSTPEQVVDRAMETSRRLMTALYEQEWVHITPSAFPAKNAEPIGKVVEDLHV